MAAGLVGGTLRLHGWVYKIETGKIFAFDSAERQLLPVGEAHLPDNKPRAQLQSI